MTHKPTTRAEMVEALLKVGTHVHPHGVIGAVLFTGGERYYMFIGHDGAVSMLPAAVVERARTSAPAAEAEDWVLLDTISGEFVEVWRGPLKSIPVKYGGDARYVLSKAGCAPIGPVPKVYTVTAADPPQGEPSDTERLDCVLKWASEIVAKIPGGIRCIETRADIDAVLAAHRREREREGK